MVQNKNRVNRQQGALERLRKVKFTEKVNAKGEARTQEAWQAKVDQDIDILEKRLGV